MGVIVVNIVHFGQKNCMTREGGVEIVVAEIAKREFLLGHNVTCINRRSKYVSNKTHKNIYINEWNGIHLKYVPTIDIKGLAAVTSSFFASILSAFGKYDVVHIHAEGPNFFSFIPKFFGKKVISHVHGLDWKRSKWGRSFASEFIKRGEKHLVKYADEIIVLNKTLQDYFKKTYNRDTVIINNGISKFEKLSPKIIKKEYGLDENSYILYLSRLVPEKRCDLLIEAYKKVVTNKKLVIAGWSSDTDDYVKKLKKIAFNDNRIIFTGFVESDELTELYSNAYIYVLPSDLEGMPLSLLEAMSYGNCCLTSDIDECAEFINDKGVLFKNGDLNDLIIKLNLLLKNKDLVNSYKNNSSDYICNKYSWDNTTKEILQLYNKALRS